MTGIYRITGYGETVDFPSLAKAQATVRKCGDDFAATTLRVTGAERGDEPHVTGRIVDERGEHVGDVIEAAVMSDTHA